jgi:hypothetical protein
MNPNLGGRFKRLQVFRKPLQSARDWVRGFRLKWRR